jgi:hypothetical protein
VIGIPSWRVALRRIVLAVVVAALFAAVIPAAYTEPPDPTWLAGYWDDDDLDDLVVLVTATPAIDARCPVRAEPIWMAIERVQPLDMVEHPAPCPAADFARAPPVVSPPSL